MSTPDSDKSQGTNSTQAGTPEAKRGSELAKKAVLGLAAAVVVATGAAVITYFASEADAWVGTVNGNKIPRDDFNRDLEIRKKQYQQRLGVDFNSPSGKEMVANLRKDVIQQLVEREILLTAAAERKLTASDAEVETRIKGVKTNFPDEAGFKKALAENGIDYNAFRTHVAQSVLIEKLRDSLTKDATVSIPQAQEAFAKNEDHFKIQEEVKASHILVKTEKEAKDLVAKLKGGADFAELARKHSEDTGSKDSGGDLGFFARGRMVPEFEQAAFGMKPGQLSEPIKSQFGYHVIKVADRHQPRNRPFEEVKSEILDQMLKGKKEKDFGDWLTKQKDTAKVVIRPQYQAAVPPPPASNPGGPVPVGENPGAPGAMPPGHPGSEGGMPPGHPGTEGAMPPGHPGTEGAMPPGHPGTEGAPPDQPVPAHGK